ncbi:hypothetical protein HK101_005212, partial [Irineochytrium annulatum]
MIVAELASATVVDHKGWLRLPQKTATAGRIGGLVLALMGVVCVNFGSELATYLIARWEKKTESCDGIRGRCALTEDGNDVLVVVDKEEKTVKADIPDNDRTASTLSIGHPSATCVPSSNASTTILPTPSPLTATTSSIPSFTPTLAPPLAVTSDPILEPLLLFPALAGVCLSLQVGMNGALGHTPTIGPYFGAMWSVTSSLACMALFWAFDARYLTGAWWALSAAAVAAAPAGWKATLSPIPWYSYLSGALGLAYVLASTALAPRLGAATLLGVVGEEGDGGPPTSPPRPLMEPEKADIPLSGDPPVAANVSAPPAPAPAPVVDVKLAAAAAARAAVASLMAAKPQEVDDDDGADADDGEVDEGEPEEIGARFAKRRRTSDPTAAHTQPHSSRGFMSTATSNPAADRRPSINTFYESGTRSQSPNPATINLHAVTSGASKPRPPQIQMPARFLNSSTGPVRKSSGPSSAPVEGSSLVGSLRGDAPGGKGVRGEKVNLFGAAAAGITPGSEEDVPLARRHHQKASAAAAASAAVAAAALKELSTAAPKRSAPPRSAKEKDDKKKPRPAPAKPDKKRPGSASGNGPSSTSSRPAKSSAASAGA